MGAFAAALTSIPSDSSQDDVGEVENFSFRCFQIDIYIYLFREESLAALRSVRRAFACPCFSASLSATNVLYRCQNAKEVINTSLSASVASRTHTCTHAL